MDAYYPWSSTEYAVQFKFEKDSFFNILGIKLAIKFFLKDSFLNRQISDTWKFFMEKCIALRMQLTQRELTAAALYGI